MAPKRQSSFNVGAQDVWPFKRGLEWFLENPSAALDKDTRPMLERLLNDPRASNAWSVIRAHSEQHDGPISVYAPVEFIGFLITVRIAADEESEANAKIPKEKAKLNILLNKFMKEVARKFKQLPFGKREEFLKRAGKWLSELTPLHVSEPRVRSDQNGSRARTYFIRDLSALLHEVTGKWLDEQVAVITEIAFNTDDIVDIDSVRKARSQRKARSE